MGLTKTSVGKGAVDCGCPLGECGKGRFTVALAGNPNVGKSTVFNALTGMKQHTGNWPGKTVSGASGVFCSAKYGTEYCLVDIPGTYSLMARSAEEEVASDFICFSAHDANIVVCDATCLERNLNLVLQIIEVSPKTVVCVNLLDEAKRKKIKIDIDELSRQLGVRAVGVSARKRRTLKSLVDALDELARDHGECVDERYRVNYGEEIESALDSLIPLVEARLGKSIDARFAALRLLEGEESTVRKIAELAGDGALFDAELCGVLDQEREKLREAGIYAQSLSEKIVGSLVRSAEEICRGVVVYESDEYGAFDRKIDRILTSRATGYPIMLIMLGVIFWLTIVGANYISSALSKILFGFGDVLGSVFSYLGAPDWLHGAAVLGAYRVLAWVVSVMLPPMAVFFPLFTILEDVGYLPRVAYDLDHPFKRCNACGKQALTMCMGFGCNAAGVVGCRIIDSPRERLLAVLTNSFVPCNGKFPMLISLISIFFIGAYAGRGASIVSAALLVCLIVLCVAMSFFVTWLLSKTLLRGLPSSFALELPPYRMPKFGSVIVRSVFDRTLFVLGRAVTVAAPAGVVIWLMANVVIGGESILSHAAGFLDPFARLMGLDGVILIAFILGFPANEIVIPIAVMAYMAEGTIIEASSLMELGALFTANGWTWITAVSVIIFSLFHWPCSTTLMTVKKETGSLKWTLVAALLPTVVGILACIIFANVARLFSTLLYM